MLLPDDDAQGALYPKPPGFPRPNGPAVNWKPNEPSGDGGREAGVPLQEVVRKKGERRRN